MPAVLTTAECQRVFEALGGTSRLMAQVMYGGGLRLTEMLRLRVKDLDHSCNEKGGPGRQKSL